MNNIDNYYTSAVMIGYKIIAFTSLRKNGNYKFQIYDILTDEWSLKDDLFKSCFDDGDWLRSYSKLPVV